MLYCLLEKISFSLLLLLSNTHRFSEQFNFLHTVYYRNAIKCIYLIE